MKEYSNENLEEGLYYPMLVPDLDNSKTGVRARWDKFRSLPENIQDKISSDESAEVIKSISDSFNLNRSQIISVSRSIRRYYFGEISLNGILAVISQETRLNPMTCERIYQAIQQKIINGNEEIKAKAQITKTTISQALKKIPEIGEQRITSDQLEMKSFPYPVRPSINNWISDYTFNVGLGNRDSMVRGKYLFHNKNTEKLSETDRSHLLEILRSFDENTEISIDESRKTVIFSQVQKKPEPVAQPNQPIVQNIPRTSVVPIQKAPIGTSGNNLDNRLSAWRRNLAPENVNPSERQPSNAQNIPENQTQPNSAVHSYDSKMTFSSPQRLPIEKDLPSIENKAIFSKLEPAAKPARVQANEPVDLSKMELTSGEKNLLPMKNVVNLKED